MTISIPPSASVLNTGTWRLAKRSNSDAGGKGEPKRKPPGIGHGDAKHVRHHRPDHRPLHGMVVPLLLRESQENKTAPTIAPTESMATSSGDPKRSSVHDWCHSSNAAYATAISTAWTSAASCNTRSLSCLANARQHKIDSIPYSTKCAIFRKTSWTVAIDSAEISGANHFKKGPMIREVCEPEKRSVEKKKMILIHAITQIHELIIGLRG